MAKKGSLIMEYVPSKEQLADGLSKHLTVRVFEDWKV
jgi:hypothetical protein